MNDGDNLALQAAIAPGTALCTIVGIEGSFSRRLGAQLAVNPEGGTIGSLADGCLERQLARESAEARAVGRGRLVRFGAGSRFIDFRLPCGSGLDIWIDPEPDRAMLARAAERLRARKAAGINIPLPVEASATLLRRRAYMPDLHIVALGEGPELANLVTLASAMGIGITARDKSGGMALGSLPDDLAADAWTAILLLFHDHEWERALLPWALGGPAFHIGAQGGAGAREQRRAFLAGMGWNEAAIARVHSPVGLIPRSRDAGVLALSALAEIVSAYQALHPLA